MHGAQLAFIWPNRRDRYSVSPPTSNQEIKKTVAAFFIGALKDGYTDVKVEQKKKKAVKESKNEELKQKLISLEKEFLEKRNEKIKHLLAEDETVNERTLNHIKTITNPALIARLKKLGLSPDTMTVQHFREDKELRHWFIKGIVNTNLDYFSNLEQEYKSKIERIKKQLRS